MSETKVKISQSTKSKIYQESFSVSETIDGRALNSEITNTLFDHNRYFFVW